MNHCSGEHEARSQAPANPYAAPQAELAETSAKLSARDVLRSVIFRRRVLMVLGVVRVLGGSALLLFAAQTFDLAEQLIGGGLGILSFVAGVGLTLRKDWGRKMAIAECGVQIVAAIFVMAWAGMSSLTRAFDVSVLQLCVLVWNSAYLRFLLSPLSRSACAPRTSISIPAETTDSASGEHSWIDILLMVIGFAAVVIFGLVGGMLSIWNLPLIRSLIVTL